MPDPIGVNPAPTVSAPPAPPAGTPSAAEAPPSRDSDSVDLSPGARRLLDPQQGPSWASQRIAEHTRPFAHDNPSAARLKDEFLQLNERADLSRDEAMHLAMRGGGDFDGQHVTVDSLGGGRTRVRLEGPDGSNRELEFSDRDPSYVRDRRGRMGSNQSSEELTRQGTTISYAPAGQYKSVYALGPTDSQGALSGEDVLTRSTGQDPLGKLSPVRETVKRWGGTEKKVAGREPSYDKPLLGQTDEERRYKSELFERYGYTPEARTFLGEEIPLILSEGWDGPGLSFDGYATIGKHSRSHGGPSDEGAIHELGHEWYNHKKAQGSIQDSRFQQAVYRLADDPAADPDLRKVARFFTYGERDQGPKLDARQTEQERRNTTEMYASLASGARADLSRYPPYMREFYADIFTPRPLRPGVQR